MKVLHLSSSYPFTDLYKNLLNELDKRNINQSMYVPIDKSTLINTRILGNARCIDYTFSCPFNKIDRYIYYTKINKIYNDIKIRKNLGRIDLTHAHFLFSDGGVAYKIKKKFNTDYIVAVRNSDVNFFFKYGIHIRKYGVKILVEAKKIIFLSPAYKDFVIKKYVPIHLQNMMEEKSVVIPNGIDEFWLDHLNTSKELNRNYKKIKLIYVGEINQNKNVHSSIKALKLLKDNGYNVSFDIIGEGPYEDKIKKMITDLELQDSVRMFGYISSKNKLIEMYRTADIFLMPSYKETFGLVYIEAMTQGLPIIYSRGQGVDGYFENGKVGYRVLSNDVVDIKNEILKIKQNYTSISKNAIEKSKEFKWSEISNTYIDIYNE